MITFIMDTYKSNKIKISVNEMTVIDSEMCVTLNNEAYRIYQSWDSLWWIQTKEEKHSERDGFLTF